MLSHKKTKKIMPMTMLLDVGRVGGHGCDSRGQAGTSVRAEVKTLIITTIPMMMMLQIMMRMLKITWNTRTVMNFL